MRRNAHLADALLPLFAVVVVAVGVSLRADAATRPAALALALPAAAVLALRRRAPATTLVVSGGLVLGLFAVDHAAGAVGVIAPAAALYSLALTRGRVHLIGAAIAAVAAVVVADTLLAGGGAHGVTLQTVAHVALVAVPVLAAEALRNKRSYVEVLLERLQLSERTREEEAQRRVEQERLRIARDLHDVVAHTLTTINVQAGVAAHLLDRDPTHVRGALATIEAASHDALEELRAILGVLRTPDGATPLEPAPGLTAIDDLVARTRAAGGRVDVHVEGERAERVPEAVQLAAFRIVQESLTNARRHAPDATARVSLDYRDDGLRLAIENDSPESAPVAGGGVGILGMRERATALGGTFDARRTGDAFRVVAELPYRRG